ncbi:MAG TPA: monofunctional biosynthetic peptidoglycan transglycosylase [Methylococcaceae bacterium]|jgi:monofunctional biosynthetic peptidoglycan transglycosylase|nr:monofunctional biosynthetic peptidoglycan transglycosylase [Methylococcaceae bacterium]
MDLLIKAALAFFALTLLPVALLRWLPPPASAFMLEAQVLALWQGREDFNLSYRWRNWDQISPYAGMAVVASEDQSFSRHFGFDFRAIAKAWESNRDGRRIRGASTISQQTAKNLFLYPRRNYLRKGLETYFTVLIEQLWPKRRILEIYLNIAQFGDGIYGVEAASRAFFRKPARHLDAREAALLAAVLPNPIRLRVERPSALVKKRQAWILRQMRQLGGTDYLEDL